MGAKSLVFGLLLWLLTACSPTSATPPIQRIALLAPFEGRYREIGYDAIYPVRLALSDATSPLVLVTVDDGGTPESAATQARRLAADPTILAALVIGPIATHPSVLQAFEDVPVVSLGLWNAAPTDGVYLLASEKLSSLRTSAAPSLSIAVDTSAPVTGGELFALKQYPVLRPQTDGVSVVLSAIAPPPDFSQRLSESGLYVPSAGALATIAYDAGGLLHTVLATTTTRADVHTALTSISYNGLNGRIAFGEDGWWSDAPIVEYDYQNDILTPSPAP